MFEQAVRLCPDELWHSGKGPRKFWRIAYHVLFYTHLYLQNVEADFKPWRVFPERTWSLDSPPDMPPLTKDDIFDYLQHIRSHLDAWLEAVEIEREDSGFYWYEIPKLDHQILNIKHLENHNGEMTDRLLEAGIDIDWISTPLSHEES